MTPPFFKTSEDLEAKIEEYFAHCDEGEIVEVVRRGEVHAVKKAIPYTVVDLAYFLGYASRFSIQDLKQHPVYSHAIMRALARIEGQRVRKALNGEQEPRFAQFDLKNNFGYKDAQEITQLTITAQLTDVDLKQRLALLEAKMQRLQAPIEATVIEHSKVDNLSE